MAELVDAPDLGSGAFGREGSTPFARTIFSRKSLRSNICKTLLLLVYLIGKSCR